MKPIGSDFFTKFRFPSGLRGNGAGMVAFAAKRADLAADRNLSSLWLWQGGKPQQLAADGELRGHWWWGKSSLVLARPGTAEDVAREKKGLPCTSLQRLPVTGPGEAVEFLKLHMAVEDAAGLPDGRLLLVTAWDPAVDAALKAAKNDLDKAAGLLEKQAGVQVFDELPFWSNGEGITNGQRKRLYLWDGKALAPLTDEKTTVEGLRVAPSGLAATFIATRYEQVMPLDNRLLRLDTHRLKLADITFAKGPFTHYAAAPVDDDTLLVCGCDRRDFGLNQNPVFYRAAMAGGPAEAIELSGRYDLGASVCTDLSMAGGARMEADDGLVWWNTTIDESAHLMTIDPASGEIRQISRQEGAVAELAREDGATIVIAMRGLEGPEVYRISDDGSEARLSAFNTAVTKEVSLAEPRPLSFTNSAGTEIRGWVMLPPDLPAGGRCPAILNIHGGPKTVYGPVLFHEMQYWAGQGYAVLFCNPTGGDGRGDGFADIRGHYGEQDYRDIMAFLDVVLAACPAIDPARLGVTGGSYGGFMTNWIIGHTTRFAAAASQRSISNWLSMATMSDIGYYFVPDQAGTGLWENPATVLGQSPLKFADRVKTPTLFIHSDEDYRCPLAEGVQMFTALRQHGVDTRLCVFKGENHELSRSGKPSLRVRRLQEITEWFDRYLKPQVAEG